MSKLFIIIGLVFCFTTISGAQDIVLSDYATISVVVTDPGKKELFEAFGHPAIRVYDPVNQIDDAFNYGVFDFNQPNFYLNFTKGYLNYKLDVWPYPYFQAAYIQENRSVREYVLNLSSDQKQEVFNFLATNALPENCEYYYDYFYDNCATRIWDVFEKVLKDDLIFDDTYVATGHSFRTLVDSLTVHKPWGDFGIDLCLGLPMDKKLSSYEYMYLPEFLGRSINAAKIKIDGDTYPFTKSSKLIFQSRPQKIHVGFFTPKVLFWGIFVIAFALTFFGVYLKRKFRLIDLTIFGITGLIGLLLLLLSTVTDHEAAENNLNLLWANPLYLIGWFGLWKKNYTVWVIKFFKYVAIFLVLVILTWPWNPQGYNPAMIAIALTLCLRAWFITNSPNLIPQK